MTQYRRSQQLDSSSTSAVLIKTRTNVCHGITAHTLWRSHGEHQLNTKSFRVLLPAREYAVMYTWRPGFGGVVNFFPFII